MAKGRLLCKSISLSEKVNLGLRNPLDCLLYTWGLTHADDEGRIEGSPETFRGRVAPILPGLTDARTQAAITAMKSVNLIDHYQVNGVWVIQFHAWEKHQNFHGYHRSPSFFPPPPKETENTRCGVDTPDVVLKVNENKVKESKIKESKVNKDLKDSVPGKRIPDPRIQIIIDYFNSVHQKETGKKPVFLERDFPAVKRMLSVADVDTIKGYIDTFFGDQDRFLVEKGKSFASFYNFAFSKYHSQTKEIRKPDGEYGDDDK